MYSESQYISIIMVKAIVDSYRGMGMGFKKDRPGERDASRFIIRARPNRIRERIS